MNGSTPRFARTLRCCLASGALVFTSACASDGISHQSTIAAVETPVVGPTLEATSNAANTTLNALTDSVATATGLTPAPAYVVLPIGNGSTQMFWSYDENGVPRLSSAKMSAEERRARRLSARGLPLAPEERIRRRQVSTRVAQAREAYRANGTR